MKTATTLSRNMERARQLQHHYPQRLIGRRLRQLREDAGLSIGELAVAIGSSYGTIARVERGDHVQRVDTLLKHARACGVGVADVVAVLDYTTEEQDLWLASF